MCIIQPLNGNLHKQHDIKILSYSVNNRANRRYSNKEKNNFQDKNVKLIRNIYKGRHCMHSSDYFTLLVLIIKFSSTIEDK